MKKYIILIIITFLVFGSNLIAATNDEFLFKINKSFDVFGAVFREVAINYVDDIDPQDLMDDGITGMLKNLDPYTVYINESDNDELDIITNGTYSGLGITVGMKDSMLTIIDIQDGFSAQRNGIRVGDRIYKVDSVIILNNTTDELRKFTRGKPGTILDMWVLRDGRNDTLRIKLPREEIKINNVSYSNVINDGIGYIKLERFSRFSAVETRKALSDLIRNNKLQGVILDLRDNPGGLLEAAVAVSEIFVPPGNTIVSTKGRNPNDVHIYKSIAQPLDTNIRLVVLVDGMSASASEIVAGAMQDLDRGLIIGERSFGKGLVQSIFDLPYNYSLKMTTARYYTPSGRCIQRLDFHNKLKSNINNTDSVFHTKNNRIVIESNGIIPDSTIEKETYSQFVTELFKQDLFFKFANKYTSRLDTIPSNFKIDESILKEFKNFLETNNFLYKNIYNNKLDDLEKLASGDNFSKKIIKEIKSLKSSIQKEKINDFNSYTNEISEILDLEIRRRLTNQKDIIKESLENDINVKVAVSLLKSDEYNKILKKRN